MNNKLDKFFVPILSVIFGLLIGALIIALIGYNPILGYQSMLNSSLGNSLSIGETLRTATPLILTALGFAVANYVGLFNIGLSGQALAGWVGSIWFALVFDGLPKIILLPGSILAGILACALIGIIPGILKVFFNTSEVITTIMMNYILLFVSTHITHNIWPKSFMQGTDSTKIISNNASLRTEWLTNLTGGSRLNLGFLLALIFIILIYVLIKYTTLGFEIKTIGLNPIAAKYSGISLKKTIVSAMAISGGLAGLAGATEGLGTFQNFFIQSQSLGIGFDGMAVALLGSGSPIGIFISALLFAVLKNGAPGMNLAGIPPEIVNVIIAIIIFFVGAKYLIKYFITVEPKKEVKGEENK
ncbi:MAG: ABC transporter permease [Lactobacillaceae bacterium]|nr:ABC transporter permease [Lactobacillaceae bacterium]